MQKLNQNEIVIKKSKFISYFYSVENLDEVNIILNEIKKNNKKADHVTYAYNLNNSYKKSDDNEPPGTAGLPILKILLENNLTNHFIVVVRFYGGIKLGKGNLLRAYLNSAKEVIKKS